MEQKNQRVKLRGGYTPPQTTQIEPQIGAELNGIQNLFFKKRVIEE